MALPRAQTVNHEERGRRDHGGKINIHCRSAILVTLIVLAFVNIELRDTAVCSVTTTEQRNQKNLLSAAAGALLARV